VVKQWRLPLLQTERYEFTEPTDEGIEHIAENMREGDREECYATTGHRRYLDALRISVLASDSCVMAVSAYGEPVALIGVTTVSFLYNIGCPWMLGTPNADRYKRAFIDAGRTYTQYMLGEYSTLANHVDARNTKSVAWLQRLGFSIEKPVPYGELGFPFHPFQIERPAHV
jgi:RimJ/RimL family protein N-acetyltransferase